VIVWCSEHSISIGAVNLSPGGFPQFTTRSPRWRDRYAPQAGIDGRDNELTNLSYSLGSEVNAWCRKENHPRRILADDLLEAFEAGHEKISR
jgi:hypothetical protein